MYTGRIPVVSPFNIRAQQICVKIDDPNFCPEKLVLPGGEMYSLSSAIRGLFTNYDI